ncbi:MAG: hypothetical protein QNL04_12500 [SAR324 cluster bacterium]|nr:hypothetical protein [SAR324 cluster bacterium]
MKKLFTLIIAFLLASPVMAGEIRRLGEDYRSKAMGNTGIVTATSATALFYNPATLSNIFTWWIDTPMMELTYSDDSKDLYDTAKSGGFNLETQQDQFDFMDTYIGKNPYIKFTTGTNAVVNISARGLSIAGNYTYEAVLDIKVRNPSMPEISTFMRLDHVRQYGISIPIGIGQWVLGATYKTIERNELDFTYGMADALEGSDFPTLASDGASGIGSGYDLGFLYRQNSASRLMFGGVYRKGIELGDATPIPEEYALGIGMVQQFGIFRWIGALDFRDLSYKGASDGDKSINRRTHWGSELGIFPLSKSRSWISIRNGFSQGNYSTGAEISFWRVFVIGGTRYIEETGEYAGQNPSNRTVLYFSFGF